MATWARVAEHGVNVASQQQPTTEKLFCWRKTKRRGWLMLQSEGLEMFLFSTTVSSLNRKNIQLPKYDLKKFYWVS